MDKMYLLYLGIVILAFLFAIYLITNGNRPGSEVGVAPVFQLVLAVPLLLISSTIFYFSKNTVTGLHFQKSYVLFPLLMELLYFTIT